MTRLMRPCAIALSLGLLGCSTATLPEIPRTPATVTQPSGIAPTVLPATEAAGAHGWINLRIRWPEQESPGYQVTALPTTTQAIAVWVKQGGVTLGEPTIVSRQSGNTVATASLRVEAAEGLSVELKAYREAAPDLFVDEPIAQGTAANITVLRSRVSQVPVTMTPLFVPTVGGFSVAAAKAGDTVVLTGSNFGGGGVPVPSVTFNGVPAQGVVRNSDTQLTVTLPVGALTGNVVVKADGIESVSTSPFYVLTLVEAQLPAKQAWDNGPLGTLMVPYGTAVQLGSRVEWALKSGETIGQYGTAPSVTWLAADSLAGTLSASGQFTASGSHAVTDIHARIGTVLSNAVKVSAVGVDGVALDKSSLTLNAKPESGLPDPGYTTSAVLTATVTTSGPVDGRVTWSSSDPGRVTVDASGRVETTPGALEGTVTITAASVFDPTKQATASVTVTILGGLDLGID